MFENSKITAEDSVWFYYGKTVADKISNYIFSISGKKFAAVKFYNKPVHKEVYMYGVAYEQENFEYMLDYALEKAGVNKDPSFDIISKMDDRLCLATSHPKQTRIEKILNADRSLIDTYRRIKKHYTRMSIIIRGEKKFSKSFSIKVSNEGYSIIIK